MGTTASSGPADLRAQIAIVTGGARGIGAAIAQTLARTGATAVILDVAAADEICARIRADGGRAEAVQADLADRSLVQASIEDVVTRHKRIDILVNNAGIVSTAAFAQLTDDEWDRVIAINLTAAMVTTRAVWPAMVRAGGGRLVYIGSRAARTGGNNAGPAYVAAKGAIQALAVAAAKEGAPYGIRANAVMPGPIRTEMTRLPSYLDEESVTPLRRMGTPEDIAEAVLFLSAQSSNFVTGTVLNVSGGLLMG